MKATVAIVTIGALLSTSFTSASPVPETAQVEKRCSPFDTTPTYYADGKQINYSKGWTILKNQGSRDKNGTEAYSGDACAYYTFDYGVPYGGVSIYAGKKFDRGYFDVYVNDLYLGTGDAYDANCKDDCPTAQVFSGYLNYTYEDKSNTLITVRNRQHDSRLARGVPYLDVNYIDFSGGNC